MASKSKRSPIRIIISIVILLVAGYFGIDLTTSGSGSGSADTGSNQSTSTRTERPSPVPTSQQSSGQSVTASQRALVDLAKAERSGQMVELEARVVKTLPDDNEGSRHQRFIIAIDYTPSPTDSVLIAHNIDLAPRVPLEEGDIVRIYGQYEWNDRGGVLHWTHHDPAGRHAEGWIDHEGTRYD